MSHSDTCDTTDLSTISIATKISFGESNYSCFARSRETPFGSAALGALIMVVSTDYIPSSEGGYEAHKIFLSLVVTPHEHM